MVVVLAVHLLEPGVVDVHQAIVLETLWLMVGQDAKDGLAEGLARGEPFPSQVFHRQASLLTW